MNRKILIVTLAAFLACSFASDAEARFGDRLRNIFKRAPAKSACANGQCSVPVSK